MRRPKLRLRWLTRQMVEAVHAGQLGEHGGSPGIRDEGLLESALARPHHKSAYVARPDLAVLAAAYAFGLAKNHPFVDGNKRTAFMAAYVFLSLNGHDLEVAEPDIVLTMEGVAAGSVAEVRLADWFRERMSVSS
ncbi:MAG TPA: type II toxin-antitoxin system death-on-curing family toxin [Gemmatimonadaceae bacterium]|nr:type II toxin-antitoxin system death-on-curing family toxin [Gemmatimonadaceae bacterium]